MVLCTEFAVGIFELDSRSGGWTLERDVSGRVASAGTDNRVNCSPVCCPVRSGRTTQLTSQ